VEGSFSRDPVAGTLRVPGPARGACGLLCRGSRPQVVHARHPVAARDRQAPAVGVQAQGRTTRLSTNYRNTREILELAWQVTQAAQVDDEETETHVRVKPTEALRGGPPPRYRACSSEAEERVVIASLVRSFREQGIPDRDIAVLYPFAGGRRIEQRDQQLAMLWLKRAERAAHLVAVEVGGLGGPAFMTSAGFMPEFSKGGYGPLGRIGFFDELIFVKFKQGQHVLEIGRKQR